jgi:cytochrome P450
MMRQTAMKKFPPGPSTGFQRWTLGPLNNRDPLKYFSELTREYGDIVGVRILNYKVYLINHPDYIEDVLVNHPRKFIKGRVLRANWRVFGDGLLTSEGDFWLRQRRLAQPAFHRGRIAGYASTMVEFAERLVAQWNDGEERDVHAEMMRLTLQVVGKTLFDADVESDAQEVGKSLEQLLEIGANFRRTVFVPQWIPTPANRRIEKAISKIESVLYRIIAEKRASGRDSGDLLSMLLAAQDEDGSRMTDRQLRDETITLFLAGHETTANTLAWTWWLLARNPGAEAKLHAELEAVLAGRTPALDDMPKLVYAGHVITESLRLYPAAWGLARQTVEEYDLAGYTVPKGAGVSFAQWTVHRDPRWYEAPEEFRPERWEGDLMKRLPKFAYFPFGGGPRLCIGNNFALMEATLILATIAQRYRFRVVKDHPVVPLASITLRPRYGIRMVFEKRAIVGS